MALQRFFKIVSFYKNWPLKLLNHHFLSSKPIILKLRNGLRFRVQSNSDDDGIVEELFTRAPYTPDALTQIKEGDIVVDIGAQKGVFTTYAALKGAKVYSYEPFPLNFSFLKENLNLNNITATIFPVAVTSKVGMQVFYVSSGSGSHSLVQKTPHQIQVPTTTLDAEIKKNKIRQIDFLKLDCEGAEFAILYACRNLQKVQRIAMEYHESESNSLKDLATFLRKKGFMLRIRGPYLYAIQRKLIKTKAHESLYRR